MYNAQELVERIKEQAKMQDELIKDVLAACDLNVNSLSQMTDKKGLSSFSLAKIADYLNCSTDYLLGRTAAPSTDNTSMSSEEKEVLALMSTLNDEGIKQLLKQARYIASDDEYKKGTQSDIAKEA